MNGNDPQSFGDWVRTLRTNDRLEQSELAKRMGVDKTLISKVENGNPPTTGFAVALADALGLDLRETLERAGKLMPQPETQTVDAVARMARRLKRMSAARRDYWLNIIEALLDAGEKGETREQSKQ